MYSRKVNIENRPVCQCTLALLTSLCCQTCTYIWSSKTPCNTLLSSRAQDERCFGNKHVLNFPLAPDLTVSASCPCFPQPHLWHFILLLIFPYPTMCLREMNFGLCSVSQQRHALMGTACPAHQAFFPALVQLHCTHQLSSHLLVPLYHSPINFSTTDICLSHPSLLVPRTVQKVFFFLFNFRLSGQMTSVFTPFWLSQSLHTPPEFPCTLCSTQSPSIFPWVGTFLSCSPACGVRQLVCTACWSTGGTHIPRHSLPALNPGSTPDSRAAHPANTEEPCSAPGWSRTFLTTSLSSDWASVAWDLGRFFSRSFLDTKAIVLLSVKSESLNKRSRHLSFSNKKLFQCLKSMVDLFPGILGTTQLFWLNFTP